MASSRRTRAQLEAENAELRAQVEAYKEALLNACRLAAPSPMYPLVPTPPVPPPAPWPGSGIWVGDVPPYGTVTTPPNITTATGTLPSTITCLPGDKNEPRDHA